MNKTYVKQPCSSEDAHGRDEGGFYKMVEVESVPDKIKKRMRKCVGCHDSFYNNRMNCTGNYCWSLDDGNNFKGTNKPKCYH